MATELTVQAERAFQKVGDTEIPRGLEIINVFVLCVCVMMMKRIENIE